MQDIEISRERFDHYNPERLTFKSPPGLSKEVVELISNEKGEPEWMLEKRLKGLEIFSKLPTPDWGPDLSSLDINKITFFAKPDAKKNATNWEDVPEDIKRTFERLGIPEAERKALAGVGAQYESQVVYHNIKKELADQGVVFLDMDEGVQQYPEIVRQHFMTTCVPIGLHKFSALHAAAWSGGTFIYVPPNVKVPLPLQAYFRMNAEKMGQFEHTLIVVDKGAEVSYIEGCSAPQYASHSLHAGCVEVHVKEGARARYSSVENWSKNTFNLNTKRAVVDRNGIVEWVNGNMGSCVTMLYPSSVLLGPHARADYLGIAFAGGNQNQDTGSKVYHLAPYTTSTIRAKSISKDGGVTSYRGLVQINKGAVGCKSSVSCDALLIDEKSVSNTFPYMKINENKADVVHEATVGRISAEQLFYLMSRGLTEEKAMQMIVSGFIEPVVRELPLEYAVELNRLVEMEMEGAVG
ncbi:MAG: Fe-S cluster assembly protein SufB [Candidatus Aenigmarchaeota archaeon]|nr:Fe-S cluster assembly protein SufB [Candidatus Aenigmarchaeota archaeon]